MKAAVLVAIIELGSHAITHNNTHVLIESEISRIKHTVDIAAKQKAV
jgi:hypothetical protein